MINLPFVSISVFILSTMASYSFLLASADLLSVWHTDNVGSNEENKKLSSNRAESVKNYLVSKGIAAQRLVSVGKGEEHPMADNNSQLGRAANRRVELKLQ